MGKALVLFVCEFCEKTFGRKGDLTRHTNLHMGLKPFECTYDDCSKKFSQFSGLKTHENVHNGSKPYICGYGDCSACFGDPSSCARHRKETHRRVGAYCCPHRGCDSRIKRRSAFAAHLKKHGIDPAEVDLEAYAPALLPARPQRPRRRPIEIVAIEAPRRTLADEFKDQFSGFSDDSSSEGSPEYAGVDLSRWSQYSALDHAYSASSTATSFTSLPTPSSSADLRVDFLGTQLYVMDPPSNPPSPVSFQTSTSPSIGQNFPAPLHPTYIKAEPVHQKSYADPVYTISVPVPSIFNGALYSYDNWGSAAQPDYSLFDYPSMPDWSTA